MKSLIYGYLRCDESVHDDHIRQMEQHLRDFAEREGYCCADIFHEEMSGDRRAFTELIAALKRADARTVMTLSAEHLSAHPLLRRAMLDQLAEKAGAHVHLVHTSVE